jgi:hypothetical protein
MVAALAITIITVNMAYAISDRIDTKDQKFRLIHKEQE